jgi:isopenicillin N synthase-like dioxygenase
MNRLNRPQTRCLSDAVRGTIPTIDLRGFTDPAEPREREETARQLDEACRKVGFFYLTGHGVPTSATDAALEHASRFFRLPDSAKAEIDLKNSPSLRGYQRVGENVTKESAGNVQRDWHEAIDFYRDAPKDANHDFSAPTNMGLNQWPSEALCPGFRRFFEEDYIPAMLRLGADVMRCAAVALGLKNEQHFEPFYDQSFWVMRAIRYPPVVGRSHSDGDVQFGCGAHTDYGCLTFVNQPAEPTGCLEVRTRSGEWMKADPRDGAFVVNVGDMLSLWTMGRWTSTVHRVLHPGATSAAAGDDDLGRVSVPFFFEPNYDALIEPLPIGGETERASRSRGTRVVYGEHLLAKTSSNFDFNVGGAEPGA